MNLLVFVTLMLLATVCFDVHIRAKRVQLSISLLTYSSIATFHELCMQYLLLC